jgi:type IV pilus assembly protein PilA
MRRGFTLIELMIAVAIVGILSAIAIPNFAKFQARSKQTEARVNLRAMFTAQKAFAAEKDRFSKFVSEIGFSPERNNRYAYFAGQGGSQEKRSVASAIPLPDNTAVEFDSFRYANAGVFDPVQINGEPTESPCGLALPGIHSLPGGGGGNSGPGHDGDNAQAPGPVVWTGMAQGQIDGDTTLDLWSICSESRMANGDARCSSPNATSAAGESLVERNDSAD